MSTVATSRCSLASIRHDSMTDSIATVGKLASSFAVYGLCLHPSAHPLALITPVRFFFRNIRYCSEACLSSLDSFVASFGAITVRSCNFFSSVSTASAPGGQNPLMPFFIEYWVIMVLSSIVCLQGVLSSNYGLCCIRRIFQSWRPQYLLGRHSRPHCRHLY
jgi:hypothetical protein